jgi:hypothetical protein
MMMGHKEDLHKKQKQTCNKEDLERRYMSTRRTGSIWSIKAYNVSADWWIHSVERYTQSIGVPKCFVDASYILLFRIKGHDNELSHINQIIGAGQNHSINVLIAIAITVVVFCSQFILHYRW